MTGAQAEVATSPTTFFPSTATALPPARPLTPPGCCVHPWWSEDSQNVYFVDILDSQASAVVMGVSVDGGAPEPTDLPLGLYSSSGRLLALPGGSQWRLAQPDGSAGWPLPAGTVNFRVSPDRAQVAWTEGSRLPLQIDRRQRTVWVADVGGQSRRQLARITGGDLIGWEASGGALLVTGTPAGETSRGIWRVGLDGPVSLLMNADRPRSLLLSPEGGWLAFLIAFSGDASVDGLWILPTAGGPPRRLDSYGSFRWREEGSLLLIPFPAEDGRLSVLEVDASTGESETLLAPGALPGALENNEWSPSPDGRWLVYLNAAESNLWLMSLP